MRITARMRRLRGKQELKRSDLGHELTSMLSLPERAAHEQAVRQPPYSEAATANVRVSGIQSQLQHIQADRLELRLPRRTQISSVGSTFALTSFALSKAFGVACAAPGVAALLSREPIEGVRGWAAHHNSQSCSAAHGGPAFGFGQGRLSLPI